MTDDGFTLPLRSNGSAGHENGAANGREPEGAMMWLDGGQVAPAGIPVGNGKPEALPEEPDEHAVESAEFRSEDNAGISQADEQDAVAVNGHAGETGEAAAEFTDEDRQRHARMGEALLFASAEPLRTEEIAERLPDGADVERVLADLAEHYAERGVNLVRVAGGWAFRTATDLSFLMERERVEQRKLSRAALETLAIIAYHQPVTRAEIEDVRGVSVSKGTLDVLMEIGWVRVRGRRQTPGRPVTYGTSDRFLEHFGLDRIGDLPGLDELKAAGLLDTRMPAHISIPRPSDGDDADDEEAEAAGEDGEDTDVFGAGLDDDAELEADGRDDDPLTEEALWAAPADDAPMDAAPHAEAVDESSPDDGTDEGDETGEEPAAAGRTAG